MPKQSRMPSLDGDSSSSGGSSGGSAGAGVRADGCRLAGWQAPGRSWQLAAAGAGWCVLAVWGRSPAGSGRAGQRPRVPARGRAAPAGEGGGAPRSQAQRRPRQPAALLFLEQRRARRGRGRERRGQRALDSRVEGWGRAGGGGGGGGLSPPSPRQPPRGRRAAWSPWWVPRVPRVGRPRSPRPPPSQRRASSRPGSPGNH